MIQLFFTQPWAPDRNLGTYYNRFMQLLPEDAWVCITDYDVMFLTNDYGKHLLAYIEKHPDASFVCLTNRIGSAYQRRIGVDQNNHNINYHRHIATLQKDKLYQVKDVSDQMPFSGLLMMFSKKMWKDVGGFTDTGLLSVDTDFSERLKEKKKTTLLMQGIYVYHWYRGDGSGKQHLL